MGIFAFTFRLAAAMAAASLAWSSSAGAKDFDPELVAVGDTFSFSVAAVNASAGVAEFAVSPDDVAFGSTAMTTGLGGETVTITSSETIGATSTTDTFTVSTPTNFAPVGDTINGTAITSLRFEIGEDNAYTDPVNVVVPISSYSAVGSTIYGSSSTASITPVTVLSDSNTAYGMAESVSLGGTDAVNGAFFHSFTYAITYNTLPVPEPSAIALSVLGLTACAGVAGFRRLRAA
jgi:hypothetical protein